MLPPDSLKNLLAKTEYSRSEKLLLCLAVEPLAPIGTKGVRERAVGAGLRAAGKWNISQILTSLRGLAVRTDEGWELTDDGVARAAELAGPAMVRRSRKVAAGLRHSLTTLKDENVRTFVEEAIECLEAGLYRAAVVLSWVGALSLLQEHVVAGRLSDFNAEALRRDAKWRTAKTTDDLSRMKEADFLHVLESISVLGKSVKQELEGCLKFRNGCGHPNSLKVGDARAAAHVESLLLNVFSKF